MSAAGQTGKVAIDGELNIYRAGDLKTLLQGELQRCATLEVDLAGVTEVDSAGLQVLMLAKQTARAEHRELRLVGHSPAVLEVFELLDLGAWFGDALLIAPRAAAGRA
ncbi:STAS domain-containing protein [Pseudoduganella namucuonensis]|uniref:Anti-anti-sigma factor n=1 Tax=Pseudoduganella namucuonensis TaxID=1035707 RepID=A0A1I7LMC5_9BURK|nr:STAS domain-containing protein [Pseudoduganella namucuonensis]SFV10886.1 anti-anti-sigma factor [Pseudoduganella namucuonensis]